MRLTLVISSLGSGGAERVMSLLANQWACQGKTVSIVTLAAAGQDFYTLHHTVKRFGLDILSESGGSFKAVAANCRRIATLRQALRQTEPDVIISFVDTTNVLTLLSARPLQVPVIVSERVDPALYSIGRMWDTLRGVVYPKAAALVVQTESVRQWAARFGKLPVEDRKSVV